MVRTLPMLLLALLSLISSSTPAQDHKIRSLIKNINSANIKSYVEKLSAFGTRHTLSQGDRRGVVAAGQWIKGHFESCAAASSGRMAVRLDPFDPRAFARGDRLVLSKLKIKEVYNILAELKGSEPGRYIIVSGHYDSRASRRNDTRTDAPGANDDASGTAAVMELARVLAGTKNRATIIFAALTGEEQGLWGSRHLAAWMDKKGLEVEAMITNDIIGGAKDKDGRSEEFVVRVFSEGRPQTGPNSHPRLKALARSPSESDSPARQWARYFADRAALYVPGMRCRLIFRLDRFLRGGDHKPFTRMGWAAIRLTEPRENFTRQHQDPTVKDGRRYGDFPEFVDFEYVARVTRMNAAAILSLARAPGPPKKVRIAARLSNDTHLSWSKVPGATSYRVLMRRTHEPNWTRTRECGEALSCVLPESKDDWLFAVQAVSLDGHPGLPTFATPGR